MEYFIIGLGILIFGGIASFVLPERFKGWSVSLFMGICVIFLFIPSSQVLFFNSDTLTWSINLSYPIGMVNLVVDRLSAFFILVISVMSFIGTLYAIGYMKAYNNKNRTTTSHFFFLSILIASMLLVVVVQNALAFLVVWEIMSLSSFFLVSFENEKEEVFKAGLNYLIAMHVGVLFLISGFILLSIKSGSFDFNSFKTVFEANKDLTNILFILFFVGFGTKAGFVPFHTWLPKAHPAAPSHISGLMSGIMIKTGIYGILRILILIQTPTIEIAYFVLIISLISGILGVAYAIAQHDIKRLLAYHSVENIGIIGIGIGIGLLGVVYKNNYLAILGFSGGILHILNHSIFKSLLFYSVGGVYQQTHTINIEKLGGLIKYMLFTSIFFLIGSLAISGLPPFNGFVSEFFIYWGMFNGLKGGTVFLSVILIMTIAGLALIGAMALLCFTKAFSVIFLGSPRSEYHEKPNEVYLIMRIAMFIECIFIIIIGLFPQYVFTQISKISMDFVTIDKASINFTGIFNSLSNVSMGLLIFIGLFIIVFGIRSFLLRKRSVYQYKTWDCGYQAGNTRMQYTASSFASPFINLIKPLFRFKIKKKQPKGLFPESASYESHVYDLFEDKIINPIIKYIEKFLDLFSWIQSGNTQQYILYGLIFLMFTILLVLGVTI